MIRAVIALSLLVACAQHREVTISLTENDHSITVGFRCFQTAAPTVPLFARALKGTTFKFQIVVDLIDLGGKVPGCRGADLRQTCEDGSCSLLVRDNPQRFCQALEIPYTGDTVAAYTALIDALHGEEIVHDAPDHPVIIRAVATTQSCADLTSPSGDDYVALSADAAVGCAYSCPLILDQVDGPVGLSLDALNDQCESDVRACAAFPP